MAPVTAAASQIRNTLVLLLSLNPMSLNASQLLLLNPPLYAARAGVDEFNHAQRVHVTPIALLELRQLRRSITKEGRGCLRHTCATPTSKADPPLSYSIEHR